MALQEIIMTQNNKGFSNDDTDQSYNWSYVLLIQAFLKLAFYNYE